MAREGQRKVKARPKQCQGEVKHNLNRNYNLMGFDTIEINLVLGYILLFIQLMQQAELELPHSKCKLSGPK